MVVFSFLIILIIVQYISSQYYCNADRYCSECTFCGEDGTNYCSCNYYNSFCLNDDSSEYLNQNFLLNYDGCITSNQEYDICGSTSLSIKNGQTTVIDYDPADKDDFVCYYHFTGSSTISNQVTFTIHSEGEQDFDIYIITYHTSGSPSVVEISSHAFDTTNSLVITKNNVVKGSIYLDVVEGQYLDYVSIDVLYNEYPQSDSPTTTVTTSTSDDSSSNTGLIVGIIVGAVALIIIVTAIICVCLRCNKNKTTEITTITNDNPPQNMVNMNESNFNMNPQYQTVVNTNRQKLEQMFRTELRPKYYQRNNATNDCYKCTICMENFIEGQSVIVTTRCNHSFHQNCFKNWAYKNILSPKCPNCNYFILGQPDNAFQNMTIPSGMDYTMQTYPNNTIQE